MKRTIFVLMLMATAAAAHAYEPRSCSSRSSCLAAIPFCGDPSEVGLNHLGCSATHEANIWGGLFDDSCSEGQSGCANISLEWLGACYPKSLAECLRVPSCLDSVILTNTAYSIHRCDFCPADPPEIQNQPELMGRIVNIEMMPGRRLSLIEQDGIAGAVYTGLGSRWSWAQLVSALEGRGFVATSDVELWPEHHDHELWTSHLDSGFRLASELVVFRSARGTLVIAIGEFGAGDGLAPQRRPVLGVASARGRYDASIEAVVRLLGSSHPPPSDSVGGR